MKWFCYKTPKVAHESTSKRVNAASSFLSAFTVSLGLVLW